MTDVDDTTATELNDSRETYAGQAIAFFLGEQRYAFPIARVQEIQQIVAFSEVPSGGGGLAGMVNLRGTVIPAVDLRRVIGMPPLDYTVETPMIICRIAADHLVAVVVDEVQDVIDVPAANVQAAPSVHALASSMLGVARMPEGLVCVLDVDAVLAPVIGGRW